MFKENDIKFEEFGDFDDPMDPDIQKLFTSPKEHHFSPNIETKRIVNKELETDSFKLEPSKELNVDIESLNKKLSFKSNKELEEKKVVKRPLRERKESTKTQKIYDDETTTV